MVVCGMKDAWQSHPTNVKVQVKPGKTVYANEDFDTGEFGNEVVAKVHGELRRINGVEPPREFVLMDRAAVGLGSVFMHLGAEVNWHELFHDLIDDFSIESLAARQRKAAETIGLPAGLIASSS